MIAIRSASSQLRATTTDGFLPSDHRITRTGIGYQGALTDEQIQRVAPAIFADEAHSSRSERYAYISTRQLLDGMRKEGFLPVFVQQAKARDDSKRGFTKHLVRFRREDQLAAPEAREIVMLNSHDGSSAFDLEAGLFRLACANGLIYGDVDTRVKVQHRGNILHNVIEGAYTVIKEFDAVGASIDRMKAVTLERPQQLAFAKAAMQLRFDGKAADDMPFEADRLLRPRRMDDKKPDLWTTFNVVQENVIKGGIAGQTVNANGQRRRVSTREVKGIDQSTALNRALWTLADEMAKLAA